MKPTVMIIDRVQIIGFVVSTAISIILLLAKQDTITSLILGLIVAVIFQLFDLQMRLANSEEKLLLSSALSQKLYKDEWLLKHIGEIVNDYEVVRNGWFDIFKEGAKDRIVQCRNDIHSTAEGRIVVRRESRFSVVGTEYYQQAQKCLKATTSDLPYWSRHNHATRYLQGNAELVKRGVKVTRVFIQSTDQLREAAELAKKQRELGIDVYVVAADTLPTMLNEDYLIIDDKIFTRRELTVDGKLREELISVDEVEVNEKVRRFEMLLQHAESLEDFLRRIEA